MGRLGGECCGGGAAMAGAAGVTSVTRRTVAVTVARSTVTSSCIAVARIARIDSIVSVAHSCTYRSVRGVTDAGDGFERVHRVVIQTVR